MVLARWTVLAYITCSTASTLSHQYASFDIVDTKVLVALNMDESNGFNQDWSPKEMLAFNRNVFDEKEVVCQWVDNGTLCNEPVKGKDFKVHLYHGHGITSDSQLYQCRWHACPSHPMKRSSLERHMKEQHVPFKWACPYCIQTFTRDASLQAHIERSPGHA